MCKDERVKKIFIQALRIDLLNLSDCLDTWISNGSKMEASEDSFDDLLE